MPEFCMDKITRKSIQVFYRLKCISKYVYLRFIIGMRVC